MQHFLYIGVGEYQLNVNDDNSNDYWVKDIREKWKDKNWTIWACDPRHYSDYDAVESSNWIDHFINDFEAQGGNRRDITEKFESMYKWKQ